MVNKIMHIYSQDWLNQNQVRKATGKIVLGGISKLKAYKLTEKNGNGFQGLLRRSFGIVRKCPQGTS